MTTIGQVWIRTAEGAVHAGCGEPAEQLPATAAAVRQRTRFDDVNRYRPLTGARNLPTGWWVEATERFSAEDVIEAVYPLAVVHRRQYEDGTLRVVSLDDVLARQSGRYESAASLSPEGRDRAREVLCRDWCVRTPVWAGQQPPDNGIPCPEPCSVFVALAREAARWETDTPASALVNEAVEFADFETPGNRIRETYLGLLREDNRT